MVIKNEDSLFQKVSDTEDNSIVEREKKIHGQLAEELKRRDAVDDYSLRKAWKKIKKLAIYFGTFAGIGIAIFAIVILACVIYRYVSLQWNDADGLSEIITGVLVYISGIASTLSFELMLEKNKNSISAS